MMKDLYGQEIDAEAAAGGDVSISRGRVPPGLAQRIRNSRVAEQWTRYDSIVVGPGARDLDNSFFNDFREFVEADVLTWFSSRGTNVGQSLVNQNTEREDWAQDIYQTGIEFLAPTAFGDDVQSAGEAGPLQTMFVKELPKYMPFDIQIGNTDTIALFPGNHAPPGFGVTNQFANSSPAVVFDAGSQGDAHVSNSWKWPEKIMLPAQAKLTVRAQVNSPLREFLRGLPFGVPGIQSIPFTGFDENGNPISIDVPFKNWFVIRIFMRGPRYLQLRGARSAR